MSRNFLAKKRRLINNTIAYRSKKQDTVAECSKLGRNNISLLQISNVEVFNHVKHPRAMLRPVRNGSGLGLQYISLFFSNKIQQELAKYHECMHHNNNYQKQQQNRLTINLPKFFFFWPSIFQKLEQQHSTQFPIHSVLFVFLI